MRFYQRSEIKDVLGYLRLLLNPQDVVSFRRVVNMPKRGIGDATVAVDRVVRATEGIDVVEACRRVDENTLLHNRAQGAVAGFNQVMTALQAHCDEGAGPAHIIELAGQESGYLLELETERTIEAQGRIENLQELCRRRDGDRARDPDATLDEFLELVSSSVSRTSTRRKTRASR